MLKMNALAEPRREDAPGIWAWCSSLHSASQHTSSGNTGGRRTVVALLRGGHQGTRSAWDRLVPRLRRFTVSRERRRTSPSIVSGEARRGHNESRSEYSQRRQPEKLDGRARWGTSRMCPFTFWAQTLREVGAVECESCGCLSRLR